MRVGAGGGGCGGGRGGPNIPGMPNLQPNAVTPRLTTLEGPASTGGTQPASAGQPGGGRGGRVGRGAAPSATGEAVPEGAPQGRGGRGGFGGIDPATAPRVLLQFPNDPNDLLLSGVLVGGDSLAGRAVAIDAPIGKGHIVMF